MKRLFRLPFSRDRARRAAGAEVEFHLEGRIEELMAGGLSRADAEREALRRFGDPVRVEAEVERIDLVTHRRLAWSERLAALLRDVRLAARSLSRSRAFAVAAILTLGLGMGATASIFTLIQRVVLDPLPYPAAERLVRLRNPVPHIGKDVLWDMAPAQYWHYRTAPAFDRVGMWDRDGGTFASAAGPWRGRVAYVTATMMELLGARAEKGRLLDERDDVPRAPAVAVLSYGTWRAKFGGDAGIVGKTITLDDRPAEVVGVMAEGIDLPPERGQAFALPTDVWMAHQLPPNGPFYNNHTHPMIARLAPLATIQQAQSQVDNLLQQLPTLYNQAYGGMRVGPDRFHTLLIPLKTWVLGDMERSLWILFGAVLLVLAIAAANVAGLLFARAEARRRELAVRTALGASGGDLVREAFAEGLVLTGGGALMAVLVGVGSTRWLTWLAPAGVPRLDHVAVDWRVLALTAVLALLIALVVSAIPLVQLRSGVGVAALGEGGRSQTAGVARNRVRRLLVVTQVGLALVLLVGAGLLLRSFDRLRSLNPGLDAKGVLTVQWFLPYQRYDSLYKVWRFDDEVLAKIRALPGVTAAGVGVEVPFMDDFGCTVQGFEDSSAVRAHLRETKETTCAGQGYASPGFFEALRIPIITGRDFTADDNTDPKRGAVIVTKAFADRFWPGENPIGKGVNPNGYWKAPFYHVVGVTADVHGATVDGPPAIGIWYPVVPIFGRWWGANYSVLTIRTTLDKPLTILPAIRQVLAEQDPSVPLANPQPMQAIVDRSMARLTFTMMLLGIAGVVALVLAAVGLYGLISYLVVRRTSEIGVRIALGASTAQVEGLVVGGALKLAVAGLLLGAIAAAASARVLSGLLYGVAPWDPASYAGAMLVLAIVAALAGWIPARRAARVNPVDALRRD